MSEGWYYKPGDYYVIDDISGFKVRHSHTRKIPGGQTGGAVVDTRRWEPQHPQDFIRAIPDDQTVPEARPRQKNRFVLTGTWVTAFSPRKTRVISVADTEGFQIGDLLYVMLDNGEPYYPTLTSILDNEFSLAPALPFSVGGNIGDPIENTVLRLGVSVREAALGTDWGSYIIDDGTGNLILVTE